MGLLDDLRDKLSGKEKTLKSLIRKQTKCRSSNIYVQDQFIDLISDNDMDCYLAVDKSHTIPYKPEKQDCDDISRIFWNGAKNWFYHEKGINASVGWIWDAGHAFNFYVNSKQKCVFIEPQTHKRVSLKSRPMLIVI